MAKKYSLNKNKAKTVSQHINYHNRARGQYLSDLISVGPRYVFFNSLRYSTDAQVYRNLYDVGKGYLEQVTAQLQQAKNIDTGQQFSRIQMYIQFISQMASAEGDNLNKYLQNMKKKLNDNGMLSDELRKKFEIYFKEFENSGGSNYLQMINLINEIMQRNNQNQDTIDEMYLEIGKNINEAIKKTQQAKKDTQKQETESLSQLFHTNIQAYNKEINKVMKQAINQSNFKINYARLLAQKVDGVISEIINKVEFFNIIQETYANSKDTNVQAFGKSLLGYIIQQLSQIPVEQLSSASKQELTNMLLTQLQTNYKVKLSQISDNFINLIENQFDKRKKSQSIEEIVLTTGKNTARTFSQLKGQQDSIIKTYLIDTLQEKELNYIQKFAQESQHAKTKFSSGKLSRVSMLLNKGIKKKLSQMLGQETITKIKNKEIEANQVLTKLTNYASVLTNALSVKVSGPSMAEILAGKDFDNELTLSIQSGGHKIKLKNDINIIINFNEEQFSQKASIEVTLKDVATSFQTGFIDKYLQKAHGAENVEAATEAYLQQLREVKERLDILVKKRKITRKEANKFLQNLSNYVQIGVSVKDYAASNNLGFHGGTLGANLTSVIDNINNMYEIGGISKIDTDLLYFAIANCSPDAIAFGLKESIESYLAGAAAIMMFDEGFTVATNFMNKMKQELGGFDSMATVHLFRVQGKLIPAAVVYGIIASKLSSVAAELGSNMQAALKQGGNYVTINNSISEGDIPSYYNMPDPQSRWNTVSTMANNILGDSNISFTFLAGIIDILESIPKAFDI